MLWNSKTSQYFPVKQGARQGAILSPLLYSIFVNDLLHLLSSSGHGVSIGGIFCGSPMYADDLALIAESSAALQSMFDLVHNFSIQWHYQLNALKSAVLVFGESASSRSRYPPPETVAHWQRCHSKERLLPPSRSVALSLHIFNLTNL